MVAESREREIANFRFEISKGTQQDQGDGRSNVEPLKRRLRSQGIRILRRPRIRRRCGRQPPFATRPPGIYRVFYLHELDSDRNGAGCAGPLRPVRWPLRAGNADASVEGVGRGIFTHAKGPRISTGISILSARVLRPANAALFRRTPHPRTWWRKDLS